MTERLEIHLWLGSCRYYLGRTSIAVADYCECLCAAWPTLAQGTRDLIRRDVEEAFAADDRARAVGAGYWPLGHDCDRKVWENVRRLWEAT